MPSEPDDQRSILPPADPPFRGEINMACAGSTADFPERLRAPAGAPNVLVNRWPDGMGAEYFYGVFSAGRNIDKRTRTYFLHGFSVSVEGVTPFEVERLRVVVRLRKGYQSQGHVTGGSAAREVGAI